MAHYKSTLFIVIWLSFIGFSPSSSRAIIHYSREGEFNHDFTKVRNLKPVYQTKSSKLIANSSVGLYIAQDNGSKTTKSEESKKKSASSSKSKLPKPIRSILQILRGRKTLFLLSIISVLVTGTAVFILLKLFDDHQPHEDFEPEDLPSQQKIPETHSSNLAENNSNVNQSKWPVETENHYLANGENSSYSQTDNSPVSSSSAVSKFTSPSDYSDPGKQISPQVDSNFAINYQDKNNDQQKEKEINLAEKTAEDSAVEEPVNITFKNNSSSAQVDIIQQLITNLENFDPKKRHQAIWELGQRGDSRAVQPLVNLLSDSDSKEQSLILATLSEIGTRTLKPMNNALAMSLQNDNAEVRKNAIRDLTRIYELVIQISNILQQAEYDPDPEVEKTAKWALEQLNRIRPR